MNDRLDSKINAPTLLVVQQVQEQLAPNSAILASLNQIYISILRASTIVSWVQQHQPDLIILDLKWSEAIDLQLISALRLDWLTRNIPILVIADSIPSQSAKNLDYDFCLIEPYSPLELEQSICSLISIPICKSCSLAA